MNHLFVCSWEEHFQSRPYFEFATLTWPWLPISIVLVYMMFIFMGTHRMSKRQRFSLSKSIALWNLILTLFSLGGMSRTVPHLVSLLSTTSFQYTLCIDQRLVIVDGVIGLWQMLFVFSKVAELMDTVFLVLRKRKLVFLHPYHHMTVLLLSWYGYVHPSAFNIYFMTMNYTVHTFMYGYYYLKSIDQWPTRISPIFITILQILQMIVGIVVCSSSFVYWWMKRQDCHVHIGNLIASSLVYATYLCLFLDFFMRRFVRSYNSKKK